MSESRRKHLWAKMVVENLRDTIENVNLSEKEKEALLTTIDVLKRENDPKNQPYDFYFSAESFLKFKLEELEKGSVVGECFVNDEWHVFTEAIHKGITALSAWEDLIFVGTSTKTRYTNTEEWIESNPEVIKKLHLSSNSS